VTTVTRTVLGQREKNKYRVWGKNDIKFLIILRAVLSLITCTGTFTVQGRKAFVFFFIFFHLSAEKKLAPLPPPPHWIEYRAIFYYKSLPNLSR
jgi:hypothetical protein